MYLSITDDLIQLHNRREMLLLGLAAIFIFINAAGYSLVATGELSWMHFYPAGVWLLLTAVAHVALRRLAPRRDPLILPLVMLLFGWGLLLVDRLAVNFLWRQLLWVALGTAVLLAVATVPRQLNFLARYRYTWLFLGLILLALTLVFGVNPSGFGARLWLPVPIPFLTTVYFQPSELLKLLMCVFLASYFADREFLLKLNQHPNGRFGSLPYLAPLLLMWSFSIVLLVWQRDLGAAALFFFLFLTLLYLATGEMWYVLGGAMMLLGAAVLAYFAFDVVALRVEAWWNPWPDADNRAFQIVQSLYAIAAGQILGQGIGQGFPDYIPVVHSDFALAAVAEEWGLIGTTFIIFSFMMLTYRGLRIALLARRPFERYLAAGISTMLATQSLLIMGGVSKLLPLTGVTLPFVSYGGSSIFVSALMVGLLLYLSNTADQRHMIDFG